MVKVANRMGTSPEVARILERLTDNLIAVESNLTQLPTHQVNIAGSLQDVKSGLELITPNLEFEKSQQAAVSAASVKACFLQSKTAIVHFLTRRLFPYWGSLLLFPSFLIPKY